MGYFRLGVRLLAAFWCLLADSGVYSDVGCVPNFVGDQDPLAGSADQAALVVNRPRDLNDFN